MKISSSQTHGLLLCLISFSQPALEVFLMVFNAPFTNISFISVRSVLFVEETEVSVENHQPAASH